MLAADGRCKTLDSRADGYVRGEACAVLQLGSGAPAPALLLLAGSAVGQDGRSSALTAPSGPAQVQIVQATLAAALAGLGRGFQLVGVELHGTGTGLGDPIEAGALSTALAGTRAAGAMPLPRVLTAAKSMVGHGETAAGSSGIMHALHQLDAAMAPGLTHLRAANPLVAAALGRPGGWLLPRQQSGRPGAAADGLAAAGVSAFAFQVPRCRLGACMASC